MHSAHGEVDFRHQKNKRRKHKRDARTAETANDAEKANCKRAGESVRQSETVALALSDLLSSTALSACKLRAYAIELSNCEKIHSLGMCTQLLYTI